MPKVAGQVGFCPFCGFFFPRFSGRKKMTIANINEVTFPGLITSYLYFSAIVCQLSVCKSHFHY